MFLYWLASERRYVHRLSDIPKGVESERVDVPTNTEGLMAYLNQLVAAQPRQFSGAGTDITPPLPVRNIETREVPDHDAPLGVRIEPVDPPVEYVQRRPMDAGSILSRVDSPGVDVEGVVEAIGKAKGYALRRYAGAVAVRFQELEKL